eukprot:TRINITY_DN3250_c0_g1_i4.p1 TRINITY_DN3250_c0_g1~~TRINITY_DN3250_c0_g1_i4.p1  ORF type:complete len:611 (-),score=97.17 TRINITY_DN3250_c0_g1_i4:215-2047(-)
MDFGDDLDFLLPPHDPTEWPFALAAYADTSPNDNLCRSPQLTASPPSDREPRTYSHYNAPALPATSPRAEPLWSPSLAFVDDHTDPLLPHPAAEIADQSFPTWNGGIGFHETRAENIPADSHPPSCASIPLDAIAQDRIVQSFVPFHQRSWDERQRNFPSVDSFATFGLLSSTPFHPVKIDTSDESSPAEHENEHENEYKHSTTSASVPSLIQSSPSSGISQGNEHFVNYDTNPMRNIHIESIHTSSHDTSDATTERPIMTIPFNELNGIEHRHHRARRTFKNLPPEAAQNACYLYVPLAQAGKTPSQSSGPQDEVRKSRNRQAAQNFRQKKKEQVIDLEVKLSTFEIENRRLKEKLYQVETENAILREKLSIYEENDPALRKRKAAALLAVLLAVSVFVTLPGSTPIDSYSRPDRYYIGRKLANVEGQMVPYDSINQNSHTPLASRSAISAYPSPTIRLLPHRACDETDVKPIYVDHDATLAPLCNQTESALELRKQSPSPVTTNHDSISDESLRTWIQTLSQNGVQILCNDGYQLSPIPLDKDLSTISLLLHPSVLFAHDIASDETTIPPGSMLNVTCQVLEYQIVSPPTTSLSSGLLPSESPIASSA